MPNAVPQKPAYRPPLGIPTRDPTSARPTIAAALLHALIVVLILLPPLWTAREALEARNKAAGGPGPAGGGGGGTNGDGGLSTDRERLRFMVLPRDPLTQPPTPIPTPQRVEPKNEEVKPPEETPPVQAPPVDSVALAAAADSAAKASGTGGTGRDGTGGTGPGSGGGVGAGTGTGRGNANGPGTGGGDDEVYGAQVVALPILPIPVPSKVRPYRMVAYFDVDTLGNATLLSFNPSNDSRYNRRVKEMLMEMRFRPAVRRNGAPIRDTVVVRAEAL